MIEIAAYRSLVVAGGMSQTADDELTGSDASAPGGERTLRRLLSIMRITNVTKLSNGSGEIEEVCTRPGMIMLLLYSQPVNPNSSLLSNYMPTP